MLEPEVLVGALTAMLASLGYVGGRIHEKRRNNKPQIEYVPGQSPVCIQHGKVVTDNGKAITALTMTMKEMDRKLTALCRKSQCLPDDSST